MRYRALARQILLHHIDGPQPFRAGYMTKTIRALMRDGLLIGLPQGRQHPTQTALTTKGRAVIAAILAEAADTLVAAGCLEPDGVRQIREWPIVLRIRPPNSSHEPLTTSESAT